MIERCRICLTDKTDYPMPATSENGLCDFHTEEEMNRQILEAKCEGPSWGKEPVRYF